MANGLQRRNPTGSRWLDWPFRRLFEDLYQGVEDEAGRLPQLWGEGRFVPAVDVSEDEDHVILTAEVPEYEYWGIESCIASRVTEET